MKKNYLFTMFAAIGLVAIASDAAPVSYTVPATADIFDAGRSEPIIPVGGAGTLPVQIAFTPESNGGMQFSFLGGSVSQYYNFFSLGPEGLTTYDSNINPYDGISGFIANQQFPLVGVFLSDATPESPAPSSLDFTTAGMGRNFTLLSPGIGQVFYIGDGQTDSGQMQTFIPPLGATRLFLGFADAPGLNGDPGNYDDNEGALDIQVSTLSPPELYKVNVDLVMSTTNLFGQLEFRNVGNREIIRGCIGGITNQTGLSLVYNRTTDALQVVGGKNHALIGTSMSFVNMAALNTSNHKKLGDRLAWVYVNGNQQPNGTLKAIELYKTGNNRGSNCFFLDGELQFAEPANGTSTEKIFTGKIMTLIGPL
jgi:hypothetical protein